MIIEEMMKILNASETLSDAEYGKRFNEFLNGKTLHQEIKKLREYRATERTKILNDYHPKIAQYLLYFEFMSEIDDLFKDQWESYDSQKKESIKYKTYAVVSLFNRARQLMFDMIPLFENGAILSCFALWRTIYESFILSKYLLQSNDLISKRFIDYSDIERAKIDKEYAKNNKTKIDILKGEYGKDFANNYGWIPEKKNRFFEKIVKVVGERDSYVNYQYCSMMVHASPFSINHSISYQDGLGNIHALGVHAEEFPKIYNVTLQVMKEMIDALLDGFVLEEYKKEVFSITNLGIYAYAIFKVNPAQEKTDAN
ncbi:MAG: hypothetical protein KBB32_01565 [Spirochaetia bacterium]|nr:hypothetical protein [Spirochaetia bacterium]